MACEIRLAREGDAEAISLVIVDALRRTNARDYSPAIIDRVVENFSPAAVRSLLRSRMVFVAAEGGVVFGAGSLDGAVVRSVFVSPSAQKLGIGSRLMTAIIGAAQAQGVKTLTVPSSVTAQGFYARLGFEVVEDRYYGEERTIVMERSLEP
ncbi:MULTISPECIES: GNAT family N-acetyltransferase [unclassified Rhizobium]|uniref:GNAT family N-acetyltransferase n=1 Tax=unclassified Rhizobium TaxID=2613769 RepID=UPI0038219353